MTSLYIRHWNSGGHTNTETRAQDGYVTRLRPLEEKDQPFSWVSPPGPANLDALSSFLGSQPLWQNQKQPAIFLLGRSFHSTTPKQQKGQQVAQSFHSSFRETVPERKFGIHGIKSGSETYIQGILRFCFVGFA